MQKFSARQKPRFRLYTIDKTTAKSKFGKKPKFQNSKLRNLVDFPKKTK